MQRDESEPGEQERALERREARAEWPLGVVIGTLGVGR